jgi:hypothetical protein
MTQRPGQQIVAGRIDAQGNAAPGQKLKNAALPAADLLPVFRRI